MGNNKDCGCSVLDNFTSCDEENTTSSDNVEIIMDTPTIQPTDQILIIRQKENETRVYKACLNDMSAETALLIVEKAVQAMPREDQGDGYSLWIDDNFIKISSYNLNILGQRKG